ncbi:MAG TPA: epimerase [Desulfotomaculum sp.]|nr:MAG: epimerase [Desulfotomaculum sp. BICA1-6]HBX24196.1 epimerase [Desulfotomaculum sp.]
MSKEIHVVTGAFGYSGKYIAKRLIDSGYSVRTLTNSVNRFNPFGNKVEVYPFNFDSHEKLTESLKGADVLYNTYWVRFNHSNFKHASAVENTLRLFEAAKNAGIRRIVHISITNPSESSNLEYFKGKARLEKALIESGISYAILRPTVLFGKEDILINNIAWIIRNFPSVAIFGKGDYRLQPIYVDDLAALAVEQGMKNENIIIDAIGPETFTYRALIEKIGEIIGVQRPIISVPDSIGYIAGWIIGKFMGDVLITWEEIKGLKADLLYSNAPPAGKTKMTDWARSNASTLGLKYASELARRMNRDLSYDELK